MTSQERGSGARYNGGKPAFDLLPLSEVVDFVDHYVALEGDEFMAMEVIRCLSDFQKDGDYRHLRSALLAACGNDPSLKALTPAARVFDYGRRKYAEWNWAKGMKWSVAIGCAIRHCEAILRGEDVDPESGHPHFGHVQCNVLMLMVFHRTYPEGNDLPTRWLGNSPRC